VHVSEIDEKSESKYESGSISDLTSMNGHGSLASVLLLMSISLARIGSVSVISGHHMMTLFLVMYILHFAAWPRELKRRFYGDRLITIA